MSDKRDDLLKYQNSRVEVSGTLIASTDTGAGAPGGSAAGAPGGGAAGAPGGGAAGAPGAGTAGAPGGAAGAPGAGAASAPAGTPATDVQRVRVQTVRQLESSCR